MIFLVIIDVIDHFSFWYDTVETFPYEMMDLIPFLFSTIFSYIDTQITSIIFVPFLGHFFDDVDDVSIIVRGIQIVSWMRLETHLLIVIIVIII